MIWSNTIFPSIGGASIALGQAIGSVEGFKAVADLYGAASGVFVGENKFLAGDPTLVDTDPYDQGWLYEVEGRPDPGAVDARGYTAVLDSIIDQMPRKTDFPEGGDACFSQDMS